MLAQLQRLPVAFSNVFATLAIISTCWSSASADLVVQNFDDRNEWAVTATPSFDSFISFNDIWGVKSVSGPIRMDGRFIAGRDIINSSHTFPFLTLDFATIDVSTFESVDVSFDYAVHGFEVGDDLFYTLSLDGVANPEVQFVDGNNSLSETGTISMSVPDSATTLSLQIRLIQDGEDGYLGLDNFVVSGAIAAIPEPSPIPLFAIAVVGVAVSLFRCRRRIQCRS